jgi:hypothetical protein
MHCSGIGLFSMRHRIFATGEPVRPNTLPRELNELKRASRELESCYRPQFDLQMVSHWVCLRYLPPRFSLMTYIDLIARPLSTVSVTHTRSSVFFRSGLGMTGPSSTGMCPRSRGEIVSVCFLVPGPSVCILMIPESNPCCRSASGHLCDVQLPSDEKFHTGGQEGGAGVVLGSSLVLLTEECPTAHRIAT